MKKVLLPAFCYVKAKVGCIGRKAKLLALAAFVSILSPVTASAQSLAGTGYEAGTSALEEVASQLVKYIPYVVNLCYALAGIVAIIGAISCYIAITSTLYIRVSDCSKLKDFGLKICSNYTDF